MELYASFQRSFRTSPVGGWGGGLGSWEYSPSTLVEVEVRVELGNTVLNMSYNPLVLSGKFVSNKMSNKNRFFSVICLLLQFILISCLTSM